MANYAASVLAEAKLILSDRYSSPEKRLKAPGVLGAFMKNTDIAIPNVGALRTKEERPEKGYFFNRSKRSAISSRTHNHTGTVGDSTEVAFSWTTHGDKFATSLKRSDNNIMADAAIMANELDNARKNIFESIDAAAMAYLATNKTGVNVATKNGSFNGTNDAFEILAADKARFFQYAMSMLRQNYYKGGAEVVLDEAVYAEAQYLAAQGAGNSVNSAFQFGGMSFYEAIGLADANYAKGLGYFIPSGTVGVVDWIPSQNRAGVGQFDSALGGYGSIVDPLTGWTMAVHGYADRADTSAAGGDPQDVTTNWEISVDVSLNHSPLTVATESTIFEVGQL